MQSCADWRECSTSHCGYVESCVMTQACYWISRADPLPLKFSWIYNSRPVGTRMRIVILTYIFVLSGPSLLAQQSPVWDRVYTFDDSMIEMNTSDLVIGGNIARATFRWTFDQPEILSGQPQQRYKSRNEVFEFNCIDKRYRPYEI